MPLDPNKTKNGVDLNEVDVSKLALVDKEGLIADLSKRLKEEIKQSVTESIESVHHEISNLIQDEFENILDQAKTQAKKQQAHNNPPPPAQNPPAAGSGGGVSSSGGNNPPPNSPPPNNPPGGGNPPNPPSGGGRPPSNSGGGGKKQSAKMPQSDWDKWVKAQAAARSNLDKIQAIQRKKNKEERAKTLKVNTYSSSGKSYAERMNTMADEAPTMDAKELERAQKDLSDIQEGIRFSTFGKENELLTKHTALLEKELAAEAKKRNSAIGRIGNFLDKENINAASILTGVLGGSPLAGLVTKATLEMIRHYRQKAQKQKADKIKVGDIMKKLPKPDVPADTDRVKPTVETVEEAVAHKPPEQIHDALEAAKNNGDISPEDHQKLKDKLLGPNYVRPMAGQMPQGQQPAQQTPPQSPPQAQQAPPTPQPGPQPQVPPQAQPQGYQMPPAGTYAPQPVPAPPIQPKRGPAKIFQMPTPAPGMPERVPDDIQKTADDLHRRDKRHERGNYNREKYDAGYEQGKRHEQDRLTNELEEAKKELAQKNSSGQVEEENNDPLSGGNGVQQAESKVKQIEEALARCVQMLEHIEREKLEQEEAQKKLLDYQNQGERKGRVLEMKKPERVENVQPTIPEETAPTIAPTRVDAEPIIHTMAARTAVADTIDEETKLHEPERLLGAPEEKNPNAPTKESSILAGMKKTGEEESKKLDVFSMRNRTGRLNPFHNLELLSKQQLGELKNISRILSKEENTEELDKDAKLRDTKDKGDIGIPGASEEKKEKKGGILSSIGSFLMEAAGFGLLGKKAKSIVKGVKGGIGKGIEAIKGKLGFGKGAAQEVAEGAEGVAKGAKGVGAVEEVAGGAKAAGGLTKGVEAAEGVGGLAKSAEVAEGAGKGIKLLGEAGESLSVLGKFGKLATGLSRGLGKLALPLTIIFAVFDFISGFMNAGKILGKKGKLNFGDRVAGGVGGIFKGFFGIIDFVLGLIGIKTHIGDFVGRMAGKQFLIVIKTLTIGFKMLFKVLKVIGRLVMLIMKPFIEGFMAFYKLVLEPLVGFISKIVDVIGGALEGIIDGISGALDWIEKLVDDPGAAFKDLYEGFTKALDSIKNFFMHPIDTVLEFLGIKKKKTEDKKPAPPPKPEASKREPKTTKEPPKIEPPKTTAPTKAPSAASAPVAPVPSKPAETVTTAPGPGKPSTTPTAAPGAASTPAPSTPTPPSTAPSPETRQDTAPRRTGQLAPPESLTKPTGQQPTQVPPSSQAPAQAPTQAGAPAWTPVYKPEHERETESRVFAPSKSKWSPLKMNDEMNRNKDLIVAELKSQGMNERQIAAILGNVGKESGFTVKSEGGAYTRKRAEEVFGKARVQNLSDADLKDPKKMLELQYAGRMGNKEAGEGYKYRGRGFIQLTGKNNYTEASKEIFGDDRLVKNPDLVSDPKIAAKVTAWFTQKHGKEMAARAHVDLASASQKDMNHIYTSAIAGHLIDKNKKGDAYLAGEVSEKVDTYADQFGGKQDGPAPVLSATTTPFSTSATKSADQVNKAATLTATAAPPAAGSPTLAKSNVTPPPPTPVPQQQTPPPVLTASANDMGQRGMRITQASTEQRDLARQQNAPTEASTVATVIAPTTKTHNTTVVDMKAQNVEVTYQRAMNSQYVPT